MSLFDNHLNENTLNKESDRLVLENYKISNSGNTLIPKVGFFKFSASEKRKLFRSPKAQRIPAGTFKEERSIFRSMYGGLSKEDSEMIYPIFENIIRDMNLNFLIYNDKRYYSINREIKRKISHVIKQQFDKEAHEFKNI